ncbi:alpha/beta fold hydrolase [Sphingosinicella sp.]|uniref:alpha/beta fold hydrolase n=1 Tax=Sphingosinicella sp. TaxID=1917971 RepID=UPI0040381A8A
MNRRHFLLAGLACAFAAAPAVAQPARFQPTRFSVQVRGSGPDVILIPGLTSGRDVWADAVAAVPGYRYHLIQIAGFGGEPARDNGRGPIVGPLADQIARYIETRGLRQPALVGHSMGGTLAMLVALRRPELAGRVMVVDMLPQPAGLYGGTASGWGALARSLGAMMDTSGGRQLFANLMGAFSPPGRVAGSDPHVVGRAMSELGATDLGPELGRLRAPLTVVYASPDARANAIIDRQFAAAYAHGRGARLIRVDGSSHMVMRDQPARFAAVMRRFLTR